MHPELYVIMYRGKYFETIDRRDYDSYWHTKHKVGVEDFTFHKVVGLKPVSQREIEDELPKQSS